MTAKRIAVRRLHIPPRAGLGVWSSMAFLELVPSAARHVGGVLHPETHLPSPVLRSSADIEERGSNKYA